MTEAIDLQALLELKRNLRWRKWPEEKPKIGEFFLVPTEPGYAVLNLKDDSGFCSVHLLTKVYGHSLGDGDQWFPLSALPKPEGGE